MFLFGTLYVILTTLSIPPIFGLQDNEPSIRLTLCVQFLHVVLLTSLQVFDPRHIVTFT